MMLFKIAGMALLLCSCTAVGFLKSFALKKRVKILGEICIGLAVLRDKIIRGGEKDRLLRECFSSEILDLKSGDNSALNYDDIKLFFDFLKDFGTGVTKSEIEKISMYESLLLKRKKSAEEKALNECRLYKTIGFCAGFCGCIFLF